MVTKTPEELSQMSPAELKAHAAAEEKIVFGHDHKKDRHGTPLEQGIGAPGHETANHWAAMRKREQMGLEPAGTTDRLMDAAAAAKGGGKKPTPPKPTAKRRNAAAPKATAQATA